MAKKRKKKSLLITKLFTQVEVNQMIQEEIDKIDKLPNAIDALIEQYLPDKDILQTIKEGLTADKVISAMVIAGEGMKEAHSMTKDFVDVPDWSNRLKAADMSLRLKGKYPAEKHEHTGKDGGAIEVIDAKPKLIARLAALATRRQGASDSNTDRR